MLQFVAARGGEMNQRRELETDWAVIYISVIFIHYGAALQSCDWLGGAAGTGTWWQRGEAAS
jgi:hypothetical protein